MLILGSQGKQQHRLGISLSPSIKISRVGPDGDRGKMVCSVRQSSWFKSGDLAKYTRHTPAHDLGLAGVDLSIRTLLGVLSLYLSFPPRPLSCFSNEWGQAIY